MLPKCLASMDYFTAHTNFTFCRITMTAEGMAGKAHATWFSVSVRCYVSAPACSPCMSSRGADTQAGRAQE